MTTQTSPVRTGTGLPWPALLTLGGATLVMVTAEMLPTALLLPMSAGLGVCCRRTSWTDVAGPPATSCTTRIVLWIERTYNRRRRQRALGKLTPVEYELAFTTRNAAPAA